MIGRQISHFYIIRALGSGGMGVVYEAQDTRLPRSVAIKFLSPALSNDPDAIKRFKREAQLASSLNHPNICTVLDVDEGDAQLFIAMELLHGQSLKVRLAAGPLGLDEVVDIAIQIADALTAAHAHGIIHRDITPGNVFLTDSGLVKLLDFGLAKHLSTSDGDAETTNDLSVSGAVGGTIYYMAPEQLAKEPRVDYRCDLFSLGAVLYQMASGGRPFELSPRSALIDAIQAQAHVPLRQLAPHHPALLANIVDKLLAKAPEDRYQTAGALRAELEALRPGLDGYQKLSRATPQQTTSVAVLPFELIGGTTPQAVQFREGLVEDLTSRLSAVKNVRVAPRTSVRALTGQASRDIGKRLDVQMLVEGSVQHTEQRVRVTAALVDARHERSVGAALRIERDLGDLLETQDEIARDVCAGLLESLVQAPHGRYTTAPDAYHAFKRGQHHWTACFTGGWRPAIEHFEYAIARDPQFAMAHVALASAYNFLGFYCLIKPTLAFGVAKRAAERALDIEETLATAHLQLALARFGGEWDWEGAEDAFRRALALDAANPLTHVHYSWLLIMLGREDAALAEAQQAHTLAPSSRFVAGARAETLYLAGHYSDAIQMCNDCLRFDRDYVFAIHVRGLCHLARSMREEAVADLERTAALTNRAPFHLGLLGRCYGQYGLRDQALSLITELHALSPDTYVPPQCYVYIYAGLGERDRALNFQKQAYEDRGSPFNYLAPCIRDLYALDPYHKERLRQMRLSV